ncbi:MAG: Rap1a/Tai family immunity protein [Sphingobium sp.]
MPHTAHALTQDYAQISSLTAAELNRICARDGEWQPAEGGFALSPCTGYILGVADQLSAMGMICFTGSSYASGVVTAVQRYLRRHTEQGDAPPVVAIRSALTEAYPCSQ